jgi:ABC-type multidrug transport system fused ATPase/permease subunit
LKHRANARCFHSAGAGDNETALLNSNLNKGYSMKKRSRTRKLASICRPFWKPFAGITLLVIGSQSMGLVFAFCTGQFMKSTDDKSILHFYGWLGAMLLVIVTAKLFETLIANFHIKDIITDMEAHISSLTLTRISKFSIGQVVNQNSGFNQDTLKKGEAAISELNFTVFLEFIPTMVRIFSTVIAFLILKVEIGLIAFASICLFTASSVFINKKIVPAIKRNRKKETRLSTAYWEVIKHLRLVIASAQEKRAVTEYTSRHKEYGDEHKDIWLGYIWRITYLREPFAVLGQIAILGYTGHLVMKGGDDGLSREALIVALGWSTIMFNALGSIGNMQRRLMRNRVLVGKYFDLLEIPPAVTMIENPVKLKSFERSIEFRNVSFGYPEFKVASAPGEEDEESNKGGQGENMIALRGIDVTINKGEVVALVGESGSGKSTFINLLQRGYDPDKGDILIDGYPLRDLDLNCWRVLLGLVDQDPKLWDETLRYNILYGLNGEGSKVTEEELERLAEMTRINEFYPRLGSKKFDTLIGENGIQLSGGQRQRVAIARAIIKNPSILVLDEATNALDPTNERLVHEAIRLAMKGRTGIIIAHRLSTVRRADKIIVFKKGQIVGMGTHGELMASCEAYQELVECENSALEV